MLTESCALIEESLYVNYIIIISNPKVIRVDFQTSNTATGCFKNLGQLLLQRLDNQVTEISTLYGDLQI